MPSQTTPSSEMAPPTSSSLKCVEIQGAGNGPGAATAGKSQQQKLTTASPFQYNLQLIKMNLYTCRAKKVQHPDDVMVCDCDRNSGCQSSNCINKLIFVECDPKWCPCGERCENTRFSRRQYADVDLMLPTGPKGYGLKTNQDLKKGDFVMEYVGEVISEDEYYQRKVDYQRLGRRHFYFMSIANGEVIDATRKGNLSRFLNHSCNPNCETQKWQVGAELCIGIFARRDIPQGEELTFDYHFERDGDQAMKCLCGEPCCRGFIGSSSDESAMAASADSSTKSDFTIHNISSLDYDVKEEPRPVMEEAPESIYQSTNQTSRRGAGTKGSGSRRKSSASKQQQALLRSQPVIRRRTEAERILHEVTNSAGGLKEPGNVLDVLRIMNANYSRFELSMMFDVVLHSPTKAIKQEFVRLNALGALQVLMNKFRTSEELKLFVPLLRKSLDVTSCLPVSKAILFKTKTATSTFATLLVDLASHSDAEVAEKASRICEKHLAEELAKKKGEEEEAKKSRMMMMMAAASNKPKTQSSLSYRHSTGGNTSNSYEGGHAHARGGWGKENTTTHTGNNSNGGGGGGGGYRRMSDTYKYDDRKRGSEYDGGSYYAGHSHQHHRRQSDDGGDWYKKRGRDDFEYENGNGNGNGNGSYRRESRRDYESDYYDAKRHPNHRNGNANGSSRFNVEAVERLNGNRKEQHSYDSHHSHSHSHRGRVSSHPPGAASASASGSAPPLPPPPPQENHKEPHKGAGGRKFKEITDSHIWTNASEDFKDVVRQIIQYRVKKLAQQKAQSLYKDKEKMNTIIGKLFNRVMKKEAQNLDGKNFTLHSDLVKKVDHYTRSHLKHYCS